MRESLESQSGAFESYIDAFSERDEWQLNYYKDKTEAEKMVQEYFSLALGRNGIENKRKKCNNWPEY